jgi:CheY-like chemotaxis protein
VLCPSATLAASSYFQVRMKVLMVAPVGAQRSLFKHELEDAGVAVAVEENADVALRRALLSPPDVIVVAAALSDVSGADFLRMLRASSAPVLRNVPSVGIVSALGTNRELLAAGADCTLRKPVREGDLVKGVRWAKDVYGERRGSKTG